MGESTAQELIDELKAVRDSTEELYILLDHAWRNRQELFDVLAAKRQETIDESNEVVCCVRCDASCSSLAEAVQDQWISLQHDPCDSYDYLGMCADCQRDEAEQDRKTRERGDEKPRDRQKALFTPRDYR